MSPSSEKHLHIISFDIPFPSDYGGVIDVFYKIKALAEENVKVHLHCFEYGRKPAKEIEQLAYETKYYSRDVAKSLLFNKLPYIVVSRSNHELLKNLCKDDFPVLFEGLHSCFFLGDNKLKSRRKIVRTHNIEHDYYSGLGRVEKNIFKRYYYFSEAAKLESFETVIGDASAIAAISPNDKEYFQKKYGNAFYLPPFHAYQKINSLPGKGDYALYHGNLSIGENNEAALFLIREVFNALDIPLIVAGNKPGDELKSAVSKSRNVKLIANASVSEIDHLIMKAHVNILPTFQPTGIKLKLLSALYNGRFCLVNSPIVKNTGLEPLCAVADDASSMKSKMKELFSKPFEESEIEKRKPVLEERFCNRKNIRLLLERL